VRGDCHEKDPIFGCESRGFRENIVYGAWEQAVAIPTKAGSKGSLKFSSDVAIVFYEAVDRWDFNL
jgi:tRNA(Leu) C34 or U34 (ribose-2'-O)-methylase TrmL